MKKLLIAGTRSFSDYELLKKSIKHPEVIDTIISGCAPGADTLAIKYAKEMGIAIEKYPADWKNLGKAAGPLRNSKMVNEATWVIVFWDGKSRGTLDTINKTKAAGKTLKIITY